MINEAAPQWPELYTLLAQINVSIEHVKETGRILKTPGSQGVVHPHES